MEKEILIKVKKKILIPVWIATFCIVIFDASLILIISDFLKTKTLDEKWYFYIGAIILSILGHLIRRNGKKLYKKKNILKINEYGITSFLEPTTECILWVEIRKIEFNYQFKALKKYPVYSCSHMEVTLKNGIKKSLPFVLTFMVNSEEVILSNMEKSDVITAVKENFSDKIHQYNIEFNY